MSAASEEMLLASRIGHDGLREVALSVPSIHCGGCVQRIERLLTALPSVRLARVNLSTKRVRVRWDAEGRPPPLLEALCAAGHEAHLSDDLPTGDPSLSRLVRALAVAGFAAGNIMILSVSVWSGAEPQTRTLFHWISALIALPTLAYSGRIFFESAWRSLRHMRTNMDVPISIGVLLAFGLSMYETIHRGEHAYFDASVTLLFFLLIGRTLDHMMRARARSAVAGLARLSARGAYEVRDDGTTAYLPVSDIVPGMRLSLSAGERVPVDARVVSGMSEIDASLVTGESEPRAVADGALLQAGTLNLTGPLTVVAAAAAKDSSLAEMIRLTEAAEASRSSYRRIADRAARLYAPVVHLTALATFACWLIATGDIHRAVTIAIAVLIITCPCALGLAVPMVQVMAVRRLFESGVMVKEGAALERVAAIDHVVFDKTGTLTIGRPRLVDPTAISSDALAIAAALATKSRHPYSLALRDAAADRHLLPAVLHGITESPGLGLQGQCDGAPYRLGRPDWALAEGIRARDEPAEASVALSRDGMRMAGFRFVDRLRDGAAAAIRALSTSGIGVEIMSGDRHSVVRELASTLDVRYTADMAPADKIAGLKAAAACGRKVLMVGDGLNDTPALATAYASMAPATATDIGRNAADFVFLHESLEAVPQTIGIAREAGRLVRQNFAIAVAYNLLAVPIAVAGLVTPLVAAVSMSLSSIVVVANALRLNDRRAAELPGKLTWPRRSEQSASPGCQPC